MIPKMYKVAPTPPQKVGVWPPSAAKPGLVLATPAPIWPAPAVGPKLGIDERSVREIPASQPNVANVVAGSIFGGPVTIGDPTVTTTITSAYTDKTVKAEPPMGTGEGWIDIFGQAHGARVPGEFLPYKLRGGFNVPTNLSGFGEGPGMSDSTKYLIAGGVVLAAAVGALFLTRKK